MKISEVCFKASEVLEKRGWYRGDFECGGKVCALGALNVAAYGNADVTCKDNCKCVGCRAQTAVEALVGMTLDRWNDDVAHDKRQVQRKLRRAARIAAKAGD